MLLSWQLAHIQIRQKTLVFLCGLTYAVSMSSYNADYMTLALRFCGIRSNALAAYKLCISRWH